ncbi:MAG: hypothetical protein DHS20C15_17480 [Planctomycetota bacterium]|nr:MAG: hypothetical protein DHS20C15_17480 [Planctomycetota bacterium]
MTADPARGEPAGSAPSTRPPRTPALEPTGTGNHIAWWAVTASARALLRTLFRTRRSRVPILPEGPLILAPNHRSYLDPLVVGALISRRPIFMMTAKYYDAKYFGSIYRMARCIVVERDADNRRALREAERVLANGRVLVIFPEGTISPDGELKELQPGCGWLARRTGAPVYPVHLSGTREALPRDTNRLRFVPVGMTLGEPLSAADYPRGKEGAAAFTDALRAAMLELESEAEDFSSNL